jgi:hypothetical protein
MTASYANGFMVLSPDARLVFFSITDLQDSPMALTFPDLDPAIDPLVRNRK